MLFASCFKSLHKQQVIAYSVGKDFIEENQNMDDFFDDDVNYDPDGYFNDPSIEDLLDSLDASNKVKKKRHRYAHDTKATDTTIVDARIAANYSSRIKRVGEYRSRRAKLRCLCRECGSEFLQTSESLFRSAYTRCRCSRKTQLPTIKAKQ